MEKKWDLKAIDQTFEALIDHSGKILDDFHLNQFERIIKNSPLCLSFINLLEIIEKELLTQWKIKQERGLEALFERQLNWYHSEIRSQGVFFYNWNNYVQTFLIGFDLVPEIIKGDPWKSQVLWSLFDKLNIATIVPTHNPDEPNLKKIIRFFQLLFFSDPYHDVLGFLNIIELGLGFRPDIMEPVSLSSKKREKMKIEPSFESLIGQLAKMENWTNLEEKLIKIWTLSKNG